MKHVLFVVLTLFCGIGAASANAVTNTTCQTGNGPTISNPTNCSTGSRSSPPSAAATIAINQLTSVPGQGSFTSFTVNVTGSADAIPLSNIGNGPNISSNAAAMANITYQLSTPGPVRQGVITVSSPAQVFQSGPGNDSASATVSIGGLPGSCTGDDGTCSFFSAAQPRSFNFTLGTTFAFNFSEAFQAHGDPYSEGEGIARGGADLTFQLFEVDGKTPVAISAAPEPSSFSLLLLAAPAAWLYRRRKRT